MSTGYLVLETGETYCGQFYGNQPKCGEVVFNTSHSGYQEIATDPSYHNQIVVMTASMQGNYGLSNLAEESRRVWIEGFICLEIQKSQRDSSWLNYLLENQVSILSEVDTRALTLRLRSGGTPWGAIVFAETAEKAQSIAQAMIHKKKMQVDQDWVFAATCESPYTLAGDNLTGPKLAVLDFGSKENILRELQKFCREIKVFPSRAPFDTIMAFEPDGIMLTNGPGDPASVKVSVETVRAFIGKKPIFGICMGHQILALALGAKTYKMNFGHRGANHPIKDDLLGKIYVTSQNHGYAVDAESLPKEVKVTQRNLNDDSVAGFYSENLKILGIQYHPESCPGPHEARQLFKHFIEMMV